MKISHERRWTFFLIIFLQMTSMAFSQKHMPVFEAKVDIGSLKFSGSYSYGADSQEHVISGPGKNIWETSDEFHFAYRKMNGDFIVQSRTYDNFNNWFPHISPDGKWIVFLSYLPDVKADDHPFYKHVYLRMMPVAGSEEPRVIAYLYGGQGSINTGSRSPDSSKIAFVSNSDELK